MLNKTIEDYMNQKTEMLIFVPVGSPLAEKPFSILNEHNLTSECYYPNGAEIENPHKPSPITEFYVGMHFQIEGKRRDIKDFCEKYNLP